MKIKKIFWNVILLAVFSAVIFYIGWITFRVKPGFCAVMTSKTSGIYEKPIIAGSWTWRWERLLPTNITLETFDLAPYKTTQVIAGDLPSAKLYKEYVSSDVDFSYNIKFNISMSISPEQIVKLYKKNILKTNYDLQEYYNNKSRIVASLIADYIIENNKGYKIQPSALTEAEILKIIMNKKDEFEGIAFSSIEISDCRIPDFEVYCKAKESYEEFLKFLNSKLEKQAEKNAATYIETDRTLKQFEKIGELMKKYPHLQDLFKSGDASAVINALKIVK